MELKCPNGHGEMPVASKAWEWAHEGYRVNANTVFTTMRVCKTCATSTIDARGIHLRGVRKGTPLPQPEVVVSVDSLTPWPGEDGDELTVASTEGEDLGS